MKAQSKERPPATQRLQGGTLINYDIVPFSKRIMGKTETGFDYTQVKVSACPARSEIIEAILAEKYSIGSQIAMLYNGGDTPEHTKEMTDYKEFRQFVKTIADSL